MNIREGFQDDAMCVRRRPTGLSRGGPQRTALPLIFLPISEQFSCERGRSRIERQNKLYMLLSILFTFFSVLKMQIHNIPTQKLQPHYLFPCFMLGRYSRLGRQLTQASFSYLSLFEVCNGGRNMTKRTHK